MIERFVVMGVSGCGKSSIGGAFAAAIGAGYVDGDDLHSAENIAKMVAGTPLNDADRRPWLTAVGQVFSTSALPLVIGCSALKHVYREIIRSNSGGRVAFLYLDGTRDLIHGRIAARKNHFMPKTLLNSQFEMLEPPTAEETAMRVNIDQKPEAIVAKLVAHFRKEWQ